MAENQQITQSGENDNEKDTSDEEIPENQLTQSRDNNNEKDTSGKKKANANGVINLIQLREEKPEIVFTVSSDIDEIKTLIKNEPSKSKLYKLAVIRETSTNPSVQIGSIDASLSGVIGMADTVDRPPNATAEGVYANTSAYAMRGENKPGKRLPKAEAYAEAGVGRARAEFSIFEAEAKGPNASAIALASTAVTASAMARAEIGSVSANVGPIGVKLGLGVDTGVSVGLDGLEVRVLGTGFKFGPRTSISLLGSEVSCSVM